MKSILLLMLILSTTPHLFAQNKWELVYKIPWGYPPMFAVANTDTNVIYCISTNGLRNWLYKSSNKGSTWATIKKDYEFTDGENARYISAPDTNIVYISFFKDGLTYRSFDGGKTIEKLITDGVGIAGIQMRTKVIGAITTNGRILLTRDGWQSYTKFPDTKPKYSYNFSNPRFINDSIAITIFDDSNPDTFSNWKLLKVNINTMEYEIHKIIRLKLGGMFSELCVVSENSYIVCGKTNNLNGGSGQDIIYKTTDGGRNWRCVLDLYTLNNYMIQESPFGLQSIDFKDSLTGIAVGQFGKIVYTYDGGESWFYEEVITEEIDGVPAMDIRYAGSTAIISLLNGNIFRLKEDNIAPKPSDTVTICGRVTFADIGQANIPVMIGNRVTMTDSLGYYKFTRLPVGSYTVRAVNKYQSNVLSNYYYRPYFYSPDSIVVTVTDEVCDVNFTATDNRKYISVAGLIKDSTGRGKAYISITLDSIETTTNASGAYVFHGLESHMYYTIKPKSDEYTFKPERIYVKPYRDSILENIIAYPLTSITEPEQEKLMHYESGTLRVSPDCLTCTIAITDITGRELFRQPAKPELVLSWLPRGVYFISLIRDTVAVETLKIVKE